MRALGWLGSIWGIGGVIAILGMAIGRMMPMAEEALAGPLGPMEWVAVAASLVFFGYTEGYRAFQRQFSPRVVVRGLSLVEQPLLHRILFAPPFCMGFFGATRKRMTVSWVLTAGLVILILLVKQIPRPWRGIIDLGVVVALGWGVVAIVAFWARALAGRPPQVPADLPPPS